MLAAFTIADRPKIEQIYQAQAQRLWKYAYSILREDEAAADVVQQSALEFMEIFHKLTTLSEDQLRGYLFAIMRNNVYDVCKQRKKVIPMEDIFLEAAEDDVENIVLGNLTAEQIRKCISEIPPRYATYIQLTYLDELDKDVVASVLKVKTDSLRMMDVRAKRYLKRIFDKKLEVI